MNETRSAGGITLAGVGLVTGAALFWGMAGIFVSIIFKNSGGTAISLAFWRDSVAFFALMCFKLLTHPEELKIERADLPWLIAMGLTLGGSHSIYNQSVFLNGAAVTTVMQAAMPAVVTVAALYLWQEELTATKICSMVTIFIGTAMVTGINIHSVGQTNIAGLMAGLAVPVCYAGWTLCGKNMVPKYGPTTCLVFAFGVAALTLLPFQPFTKQLLPLNATVVYAFCALIVLSTFAAFIFYFMGLKYLQAGIVSILVMSEILFACAFAWYILGERLTFVQVIGALFVMIGVLWLSYRQNKQGSR